MVAIGLGVFQFARFKRRIQIAVGIIAIANKRPIGITYLAKLFTRKKLAPQRDIIGKKRGA